MTARRRVQRQSSRRRPGATLVTLNGRARFSQVELPSEERRRGGMKRMDDVDPTDAEVLEEKKAPLIGPHYSYHSLITLSVAAFP